MDAEYGFAAGRNAHANHPGTFVWGDSQDSDIESSTFNQTIFRAENGFYLSEDAGGSKDSYIGARFRDNSVIAWGKVSSNGTLNADFGVSLVDHPETGVYEIYLTDFAAGIHSLIPVAICEIDTKPTSATTVRFIAINQNSDSTKTNRFQVYINNGSWQPVDNDFVFMVTAR